MGLGLIIADFNSTSLIGAPEEINDAEIIGSIADIRYNTDGDRLYVEAISIINDKGIELKPENLKLLITTECEDLTYGDVIRFHSGLKRITDSPNSFYKGYSAQLLRQGFLYEGKIIENKVGILSKSRTLQTISKSIRDKLEIYIERTTLSKAVQNFLITVLLGDKQYIDSSTRRLFSDSGISHMLALSGLHVGILVTIIFVLLFPINFIGKYKLRYLLTILLIWGYAFITGFSPSVIRACAMCSFAFMAIIIERKNSGINSICFAYILILLFSPFALYEIGFQLSFICAFVIITLMPHLQIAEFRKHKYIYRLSSLIFVTFIVSSSTWVLTSYYFHIFPLSLLTANVIVLPILPIYISLALSYIVLFNFGIGIVSFETILNSLYNYFNSFLKDISTDTVLIVHTSIESVILWLVATLLIVIYLNFYKNKYLLLSAGCCVLFTISALMLYPQEINENDFIICNNYNEIRINAIKHGEESEIILKRYSCDSIKLHNTNIVSIDINTSEIKIPRKCDYLIVCGGYNGSMIDLTKNHEISKIIIHPSVRRKKERLWIDELNDLHIDFHSIRLQNSLKVISDRTDR